MSDDLRPYTLVAELTYRCPLRCPYCSNPLDHARLAGELDTATWRRVFAEAEGLGVVQLHLSGGEPLLRPDLEELVEAGRSLDLYLNLITGAVPLERRRLAALRQRGLDAVQVSIQDAREAESDQMAGARSFRAKLEAARWAKELGIPLTINTVIHRRNIAQVPDIIALAESLEADRVELANAQYLGWALQNRRALLPSREEVERARAAAAEARARLEGRMEVIFVTPDYHASFPKPCMGGWGRRFLVVNPHGQVLPCHGAAGLPGLEFEDVRSRPLEEIWRDSPAFNAFRGEAWMNDPCRSCERRSLDFGGCRCQAFRLTGRAGATDPACSLSPDHGLIEAARAEGAAAGAGASLEHRGPARSGGEPGRAPLSS